MNRRVVTPQIQVCRLNISLEPSEKGARLRWVRVFTGLSDRGNAAIDSWKPSRDQALSEKIEYFVKNQKKLVSAALRGESEGSICDCSDGSQPPRGQC